MTARVERALLLVASAAVLTWGTVVAERRFYPRYADSDTVWLLNLAHELFEVGGTLKGWNLSPHPNFFPELVIVELARRLSSSLEGFFLVFAVENVWALFLVSWLGIRLYLRARFAAEPEGAAETGTAMLGALVVVGGWLAAFTLGLFQDPLRYGFLPAYHFPPVWMAMLIAFLTVDQLDRAITWRMVAATGGIALLMLATGLSDRITVLNVLPGLVVAAVYQCVRAGRIENVAWAVVPVLLAGVGAQFLSDNFWNSFAGVSSYPLSIDLASVPEQASSLVRALFSPRRGPARYEWLAWVESGLSVALALATAWIGVRLLVAAVRSLRGTALVSPTQTKAEGFEVFLIAAPLLVTLAILLLGGFRDVHFLRHVIPLFHFIPLAIVMHVLGRVAPRIGRRAVLAGFGSALAAIGGIVTWMGPVPPLASRVPPLLACIERYANDYDLRHGLGHHWQSHLPTVASGHRVLVRSIEIDATIPRSHNDLDWYGREATRRGFTFVVVTPSFDAGLVEERLGPPTQKLACPETGEDAAPEYGAWSPSAREESEIWVYEGAARRRLDASVRRLHDLLVSGAVTPPGLRFGPP